MGNLDKLRSMTSIYLLCDDKILLLYRQGSKVVNDVWTGSAGGHFEENELNNAEACVLRELEEELSITKNMERLSLIKKFLTEHLRWLDVQSRRL